MYSPSTDTLGEFRADPVALTVLACTLASLTVVGVDFLYSLIAGPVPGLPNGLPALWGRRIWPADSRLVAQGFDIVCICLPIGVWRLRKAFPTRALFSQVAAIVTPLLIVSFITPVHAAAGILLGLIARCLIVPAQDLGSGRCLSAIFWGQCAAVIGAAIALGLCVVGGVIVLGL